MTIPAFTKTFGSQEVLRQAPLILDPGLVHVVTGPSGGGKTTLLRILGGLDLPDQGPILPRDPSLFSWVFQEARLVPSLSLLDNICLGLPRNAKDRGRECAERLRLTGSLDKYPHQVSGGMKTRASLARSLMHPAPWFLWDEPFSGLNVELKQELLPMLGALVRQAGSGAVVVLHDPLDASTLADRRWKLSEGCLAEA